MNLTRPFQRIVKSYRATTFAPLTFQGGKMLENSC
jgi:hypothetical protein